jgi:hypothetical protein
VKEMLSPSEGGLAVGDTVMATDGVYKDRIVYVNKIGNDSTMEVMMLAFEMTSNRPLSEMWRQDVIISKHLEFLDTVRENNLFEFRQDNRRLSRKVGDMMSVTVMSRVTKELLSPIAEFGFSN